MIPCTVVARPIFRWFLDSRVIVPWTFVPVSAAELLKMEAVWGSIGASMVGQASRHPEEGRIEDKGDP